MTIKEKHSYKNDFLNKLQGLAQELERYVSTENKEWTVKGFIDIYKNIYTISSDTKILSKILEIHIFPLLLEFSEKNGYKIVLAEKQNWYPDITFVHEKDTSIKFALDIKTTFRRNKNTAGFTLGSHGAYFKERNKSKNIQFPYSEYLGHYCLGVIYSRASDTEDIDDTEIIRVKELEENYDLKPDKIGERKVTELENLTSITSVIGDFDFFAQEKWKIASDKRGSGNTANIGSVTKIDDLKNGNGIFSKLGEEWFDEYWINYGIATQVIDGKTKTITRLKEFLVFKGREDLIELI